MIPTQKIIAHPTLGKNVIIVFETRNNNTKTSSNKIAKKRTN